MKTFEKFLLQIKQTEQRYYNIQDQQALPDKPAAVINSENNFSGNLQTSEASRGVVFSKLASVKTASRGIINKTVNPKQISDYLKEHNLNITALINDRLLRERVINGDDSLDFNYLEKGVKAGRAVCRINIYSATGEEGYGTGFLIAPQILITNHHVIPTEEYAQKSYAEFNYEKGTDDLPLPLKVFNFNSAKLFYSNEELDFTLIWLNDQSTDGFSVPADFGFLPLNPNLGKTKEGNFVSIIQHPDGKMKKVALRQNEITNLSLPKFIRYVTDTKSGSSGAPVFNDKWEVVAVHHAGVPRYNEAGKIMNRSGEVWDKSQGEVQVDWIENEGIRISSIVYDITTVAALRFPFLWDHFKPIRNQEDIQISMGINVDKIGTKTYFPEEKDAEEKSHYYAGLSDLNTATFKELNALLEDTHVMHQNYNPSKYVYPLVDLHPDGQLRSIYSNRKYSVQELLLADQKVDIERQLRFIELSKEGGLIGAKTFDEQVESLESALPYNCEHVVCQSWFNKQEPMRGDLHHLFSCESGCNSFRNKFPYVDFESYPDQIAAEKARSDCGYVQNGRFEPEQNKGIVARAVLYFLLRYPGIIKVYDGAAIDLLKSWAKAQPVTLYEQHRNREIYMIQGNRNPFIDFPSLAQTIKMEL
jgi:endonuclease G